MVEMADLDEIVDNLVNLSDDEEQVRRRPRFLQERSNKFDDLDDVDFATRFRLSKRSALQVLDLIDNRLEFPAGEKNSSVSPINQLLLCLRYYATGSTQLSAGDFSGVSQPTACRIIHRVSNAIASLRPDHIYMPRTPAEISSTQRDFYNIARFPKVIGALDCTHVRIISPGGDNPEYYRNRKKYFSINTQAICNAHCEILDLVARWPGSSNDVTIFDQCRQRGLLHNRHYGDVIIVGDGAYPNREYLMTPLPEPRLVEEIRYNESQIRTRNPIERTFGIWKKRFPVLALGIRVDLANVAPIIVATGVLHNILLRGGDPQPPDDRLLELPKPWEQLLEWGQMNPPNHVGCQDLNVFRRTLINDYFRVLRLVHGD